MTNKVPEAPEELTFVDRLPTRLPDRVVSALQLRIWGASLNDIAVTLGLTGPEEVQKMVDRALAKEFQVDPANRDRMRGLANARLERLLRSVSEKAMAPQHPEHLAAVGKAKEIIDRISKLYGLDSPTEMIVHNPDSAEIEAWVMHTLQQGQPDLEEDDVLDAETVDEDGNPVDESAD